MNVGYLILLSTLLSLLLFMIQRSEPRRRLLVTLGVLIPVVLIRNYVIYREVETEGWVALGISLFLNFTFWVLIGRYNPVNSSDEIRVLGLDD